jgi:hypothetical protein
MSTFAECERKLKFTCWLLDFINTRPTIYALKYKVKIGINYTLGRECTYKQSDRSFRGEISWILMTFCDTN